MKKMLFCLFKGKPFLSPKSTLVAFVMIYPVSPQDFFALMQQPTPFFSSFPGDIMHRSGKRKGEVFIPHPLTLTIENDLRDCAKGVACLLAATHRARQPMQCRFETREPAQLFPDGAIRERGLCSHGLV